jgi:hypothetical protein
MNQLLFLPGLGIGEILIITFAVQFSLLLVVILCLILFRCRKSNKF